MQYISTKLYTNLVNSQSFQIIQVKLMTFDLLQGHMIQYGHQTLFQSTKICIKLTICPKLLEIFCSFILDSSVRSKVEVITGRGHIGLENPGNCFL